MPWLEEDAALAARLPPRVFLGTSSWTFPGWRGIFYPKAIPEARVREDGLFYYAANPLFSAAGVDRSFYAPLHEAELARYADQIADGEACRPSRSSAPPLRCVLKAWSAVTTQADARTGEENPRFLDARLLEDAFLRPLARTFEARTGPVVLEFSPMRRPPPPTAFAARLDRFLAALPAAFRYAVELRNRELLSPAYLEVLARHGAAHVLSLWERMPPVAEQLELPGVLTAPFVVSRLSLPPGRAYDEQRARFAPFDRIVEPDPATRAAIARLAAICAKERRELWVLVNNKAEGSSPLSVRALAGEIARAAP